MTKVLTEADAAADLAGLPRAVSSEEALKLAGDMDAFVYEMPAHPYATDASRVLRTLVSERDALAGRVAELEAALQGFYRNSNRHDWPADVYDAATAALSATTPESKP